MQHSFIARITLSLRFYRWQYTRHEREKLPPKLAHIALNWKTEEREASIFRVAREAASGLRELVDIKRIRNARRAAAAMKLLRKGARLDIRGLPIWKNVFRAGRGEGGVRGEGRQRTCLVRERDSSGYYGV